MSSIGQITKVLRISDGAKPQMGPTHAIPFLLEVQTTGGQTVLEISQDAAAELAAKLPPLLQARGCL